MKKRIIIIIVATIMVIAIVFIVRQILGLGHRIWQVNTRHVINSKNIFGLPAAKLHGHSLHTAG